MRQEEINVGNLTLLAADYTDSCSHRFRNMCTEIIQAGLEMCCVPPYSSICFTQNLVVADETGWCSMSPGGFLSSNRTASRAHLRTCYKTNQIQQSNNKTQEHN